MDYIESKIDEAPPGINVFYYSYMEPEWGSMLWAELMGSTDNFNTFLIRYFPDEYVIYKDLYRQIALVFRYHDNDLEKPEFIYIQNVTYENYFDGLQVQSQLICGIKFVNLKYF